MKRHFLRIFAMALCVMMVIPSMGLAVELRGSSVPKPSNPSELGSASGTFNFGSFVYTNYAYTCKNNPPPILFLTNLRYRDYGVQGSMKVEVRTYKSDGSLESRAYSSITVSVATAGKDSSYQLSVPTDKAFCVKFVNNASDYTILGSWSLLAQPGK